MGKPIMLTSEAYNNLIEELNNMKNVLRREVEEKFVYAQSLDPAVIEDEEFIKAKEELDLLDRRIKQIENILDNAVIIEDDKTTPADTDAVVTNAKDIEVLLKIIVEREKEKELILSEAYDWAEGQRQMFGFIAQPLRLTFGHGDCVDDGDGFMISMFYKKSTGEALLRRDWFEKMMVQYNIIVNYDEIAKIAPKSLNLMLQNGLKIKKRWEEENEYYD